jgi:hypothetical protein
MLPQGSLLAVALPAATPLYFSQGSPGSPSGPFGKAALLHGSRVSKGSTAPWTALAAPCTSKAAWEAVGMKSLCGPRRLAILAYSVWSAGSLRRDKTQSVSSCIRIGLAHDRSRFSSRDVGTPKSRSPPTAVGNSSALAPDKNFDPPSRRPLQASSSPIRKPARTSPSGSQPPGASTLTTAFGLGRSNWSSLESPFSNSFRTRPRFASRPVTLSPG